MTFDEQHPALSGGATAPALAIALTDARWPGEGLTTHGGLDLDVGALRARTEVGSTGERTFAGLVLSLYGEQDVRLSSLDALDLRARRMVAEALRLHAGD